MKKYKKYLLLVSDAKMIHGMAFSAFPHTHG